jgi:uncharacterized phiE125 gp8 family phage protein
MPAPLNDIKKHLRIEHGDDDALLASLWDAALLKLENLTRRVITPRPIEIVLDAFTTPVLLNHSPIIAVDQVAYRDTAGDWQVLAEWVLDDRELPIKVRPAQGTNWPATHSALMSVKITVTAGYTPLPADLLRAALILTGTWYEHREALSETALNRVPMTVDYLIAGHKLPRLG